MLDFADRTGSSIFMEVWPQMLVSPTPAYMYTVQRARSLRADAKEGSPSPGLPDGQHQLPTFHYQETPSTDANTGGLESQTNNGREGEMCYGAQILRRKAKPQQVVTTRLLHCLQYLLPHLSRLQRIHPRAYLKLPSEVEPTRPFRQAGR